MCAQLHKFVGVQRCGAVTQTLAHLRQQGADEGIGLGQQVEQINAHACAVDHDKQRIDQPDGRIQREYAALGDADDILPAGVL